MGREQVPADKVPNKPNFTGLFGNFRGIRHYATPPILYCYLIADPLLKVFQIRLLYWAYLKCIRPKLLVETNTLRLRINQVFVYILYNSKIMYYDKQLGQLVKLN